MKTNLGLYDMKKNNKNSTAKRSKNKETINNTENNTTTEEQSTLTEEEKEALLKQQSILNLSLNLSIISKLNPASFGDFGPGEIIIPSIFIFSISSIVILSFL